MPARKSLRNVARNSPLLKAKVDDVEIGGCYDCSARIGACGTAKTTLLPQDEHICSRARETTDLQPGCLEPLDISPVAQDTFRAVKIGHICVHCPRELQDNEERVEEN
jgi:hypothetical protein